MRQMLSPYYQNFLSSDMRIKQLIPTTLITALLVACAAQPSFREFNAAKCGFTIQMPTDPKEESTSTEASGIKIDLTFYTAVVGNSAYVAGCNDFPADLMATADVNAMLDSAVDGAITNSNATLDSQSNIELDGNPGREVTGSAKIAGQDAVLKGRIYMIGNRLIQAIIVAPKGQIKDQDVTKYLESVKLVK
jgi:hypothetical protein